PPRSPLARRHEPRPARPRRRHRGEREATSPLPKCSTDHATRPRLYRANACRRPKPSSRKSPGLAQIWRKSPIFGFVAPKLTVSKTVSGGFPPTRVRIPPPPFAGIMCDSGGRYARELQTTATLVRRPASAASRGGGVPSSGDFVPPPFPRSWCQRMPSPHGSASPRSTGGSHRPSTRCRTGVAAGLASATLARCWSAEKKSERRARSAAAGSSIDRKGAAKPERVPPSHGDDRGFGDEIRRSPSLDHGNDRCRT